MLNHHDPGTSRNETIQLRSEFMDWAVDYHQTLPDFKKRPVTSFLVIKCSDLLGIQLSSAFVIINGFVTFLCYLLVVYLAKLYQLNYKESLFSGIIFLTSFSIFLAYFIPIQSYDEPIQYFFILLGLFFLKQKKWWLFTISLSFALITRESSLLLLPSLLVILFFQSKRNKTLSVPRILLLLTIPVLSYFIYLQIFYHFSPESKIISANYLSERFTKIVHNFGTIPAALRTLISCLSVFLIPLFLLQISRQKLHQLSDWKSIRIAFYVALFINTSIVFLSVFAEEARVLALPLLLVFPFLGLALCNLINRKFRNWLFVDYLFILLPTVTVTTIFSIFLCFLYQKTNLNDYENVFEYYNFISIFLISLTLFSNLRFANKILNRTSET